MFPRLLVLTLFCASAISAAPVSVFRSTSEPTKVTVMVIQTGTVQSPSSTMHDSVQARQWEWTSPAPAWSEPAWTQPAWSDPAVVPVPTEPVWSPSLSPAYTAVSTPTPTSTSDYIDTHRQNSGAVKAGWITAVSVMGVMVGLGLILFLVTSSRQYLYQHPLILRRKKASDVEVHAGLDCTAKTPPLPTPPRPFVSPITTCSGGAHPAPRQSQDLTDMPRLPDPSDGLVHGPRRSSSLYQNNIPPQETHWQ